MAQKKTKYDLLLKSLEIPKDMYYNEWDWGYYDEVDWGDYYNDYDFEYSYLEDDSTELVYMNTRGGFRSISVEKRSPYKKINMDSIYNKEKRREIKINKILGLCNGLKPVTLYDYLKNKNI